MTNHTKRKTQMLSLLKDYSEQKFGMTAEEHLRKYNCIIEAILNRKIRLKEDIVSFFGPTVSEYHLVFDPDVTDTAIKTLAEDVSTALGISRVRFYRRLESVVMEIPNEKRSIIPLKSLIMSRAFRECNAELPLAIGFTSDQRAMVIDLVAAQHILVTGMPKQGKSVCLNAMVATLLLKKRSEFELVLIDTKGDSFKAYTGIAKTATNQSEAARALEELCGEMKRRQEVLFKANVKNIKDFNSNVESKLPYIVCVCDDYDDASPQIASSIIRLAQTGHIVGIHLILSCQKITGNAVAKQMKEAKAAQIAFRTRLRLDPETIIDYPEAKKLLGEGDLILKWGGTLERMQGGYISQEEPRSIAQYIKNQKG